ncbi:MAG: Rieske 2Fe-2S domain-containing protein [Gammaproteobacteria bacterium]|nr:Rieske 2Fe-2S domain-containing protein [Gammaproteobacteria bacterium]
MFANPHDNPVSNVKDFRKQQLIEATIRTISAHGLSRTTIARVAREAHLSTGTIGFYFKGKEQLLLGTLQALAEETYYQVQLAFEFSSDPIETLELVVDTCFSREICAADKIAVWYAFASESSARKEYMAICGEYDAWFQRSLLAQVQRACTQHNVNSSSRMTAISRGLEGLIDGFWQDLLYQPDEFDREAARNICHEYLRTLFMDRPAAPAPSRQRETSGISGDREISDTLPIWTYYDAEFLELEKETIFRKNWLLVGHINDLPGPRHYLTLDAVGERAMVIRDNDHKLRAFHNVCRHRGAKLFEKPSGKCAHTLTCPFHGWTYRHDGKLVGVPAENTFENLHKESRGLVPLDLEIWMGFIFIRFAKGGPALSEAMKPVEDHFLPYRIPDMHPIANGRYDETLPYNWKVFHDVDNEGYHVPVGHPSLQQLYGKSYRDTRVAEIPVSLAPLNEQPATLWSVRNYQNLLPRYDHLPEANQRLWSYGGIFPSMVIGLYPDCIEFYMTLPVRTDRTILRCGVYAHRDNRRETRAAQYLNRRINRVTAREDETYVRTLQDGMQSSAFPEPVLSGIESGVRGFHHQIQKWLPVAKLKHHPGEGRVTEVNAGMTAE